MTEKLIFINGNINSGKTTISKLLVPELPPAQHVEADSFHTQFPDLEGEEKWRQTVLFSALTSANILEDGQNVIYSYPLRHIDYAVVLEAIKNLEVEVYSFTLDPSKETLLSDRVGGRILTAWERDRISTIIIETPQWGIKIDNTDQTPTDTLAEILTKITSGEGKMPE